VGGVLVFLTGVDRQRVETVLVMSLIVHKREGITVQSVCVAGIAQGRGRKRAEPRLQAVHIDVNDRRSEKREHLAEDEAANDGDA